MAHRGLPDVVLVADLSAVVRGTGITNAIAAGGRSDVPGALPHRGKLLQLRPVGDDDEVPGLSVFRRRRPPSGLGDMA